MSRALVAWARAAALPALLAGGAAALLAAPNALAASPRSRNEAGNALYREGRFAEARERYLAAQADRPDAPEIDFNIGDSFYQEGAFPNAAGVFAKALARFDEAKKRDPLRASSAAYNLGNALFKAGKPDEAIESYKRALRANPADVDAKHNLELALKKKEEEKARREQKQDQNQNQPKEEGKDEKKDKQDQSNEEPPRAAEEEDRGAPDEGADGDSAGPPPPRSDPEAGAESAARGMPRDDALRILEALEAQELAQAREEERKALLRALESEGKDW